MSSSDSRTATIGPITGVTITAQDIGAVEDAYTRYLDYRVTRRGRVETVTAEAWGCPAAAGRRTLSLSPAAADDFEFRFVEDPDVPELVPFSTYGWNAAEIIVRDVDALAGRLADSPFRIIGPPQNLSFSDDIRAMQVVGPGQELLYLTEFKKKLPELDTPDARCDVDRTFIMIVAGPSLDALQDFYAGQFGVPRSPAVESRVKGMSAAFGNSPEHRYPIAALPLRGQSLIEVDEMPAQAGPRTVRDGELPGGIAVVSFAGTPVGCVRGAAGEIIEVA